MLTEKIWPACESHLNRRCSDSYLEMSLLQTKGQFYCTVIHLQLLLSQNISVQLISIVKLAMNLEDANRKNNERCRSLASLYGTLGKMPICIKLQNQASRLELQDIWLCLSSDQD